MNTYAIDFETYYDAQYDIKEQGSAGYIEDPRFDAYLVAVAGDNGYKFVGDPKDFDWSILDGQRVVAHNASFDEHIFLHHFLRDNDGPAEFHCTADLAAFCGYPRSLEMAMKQMFGKTRDKTIRDKMKGVNRKSASLDPQFRAYALEDSVDCLRIWEALSKIWTDTERLLSKLTRQMGWRGVHVDRAYVDECLVTLNAAYEERRQVIPWADTAALGSRKELEKVLTAKGIRIPESTRKDDEAFQEWLDEFRSDVPFVTAIQELRAIRKTQANFNTIKNRLRGDDSFPYNKFYYGAHTGRWAGAGGFNMENMNRDDRFGTNLRRAFTARPGHTFVIADFSQIEPRVAHGLLGDYEFLGLCRSMSPYIAHGVQFNRVSDPVAFEKARKDRSTPEYVEYAALKQEVLSLIYGVGHKKHQASLARFGVDISLEESERIVDAFRTKPFLKAHWKKLENEFRSRLGSELYQVRLPSGRDLHYWEPRQRQVLVDGQPRVELEADTVKGGRKFKPFDSVQKIYGAYLFQNQCQSVARDIFAEAILRVADTLPQVVPLFTVHDEVILEVPERKAKFLLPLIRDAMVKNPPWMPDVPLDVGIEISPYYKK